MIVPNHKTSTKKFLSKHFFWYCMRSYWPISYVFNIHLPANTDKYISVILIFTYSTHTNILKYACQLQPNLKKST